MQPSPSKQLSLFWNSHRRHQILYCTRFNPNYNVQYPASYCYWSTHIFGSFHSVGHGVHYSLSSCKSILREGTQYIIIPRDRILPQIPLSQLLAPHTSGPRDLPRCGALSLLQKMPHYRGDPAETADRLHVKLRVLVTACVTGILPHA